MNTVSDVLQAALATLGEADSPTPRLDVEVLLADCLKVDRLQFITHPEQFVSAKALAEYKARIDRRKKGEPVSYIVGQKEFWSLPFYVNRAVLIPRPETEVLVEETLAVLAAPSPEARHVLDVGTGSGAIAVSLAVERADIRITATDLSRKALDVAEENARMNGVHDRIRFMQGDLFAPVAGVYDVIVSNPPYISLSDFASLPAGIRNYEPAEALLAGPDGTEIHRELIFQGFSFLNRGGWLLMEMGEDQGRRIRSSLSEHGGYEEVGSRFDYGGTERVIKARRG